MADLTYSNVLAVLLLLSKPQSHQGVAIPTQFRENMFYACPVAESGVRLKFYTDSGGGVLIYRSVVDGLHLPVLHAEVDGKNADEVVLPPLRKDGAIPSPLGSKGKLFVLPDDQRLPIFDADMSGLLGQQWFADRIWTWNYTNRQLLLRTEDDLPKVSAEHKASLGFKTNQRGKRDPSLSFARIETTVDGEKIDLLFDTGASTMLTRQALEAIHVGHAALRATSFIAKSIFERWHSRHSDWKVIENAEEHTGASMIQVPSVDIGGYTVGPVWFTERPDKNFTQWMSQWMDKTVYGALGGSALQYVRVTVDYPNATAYFERP